MDARSLVSTGVVLHGHACPPLVLGLRAGGLAMSVLGVGRAVGRELFAMVEMGSDHYAQGFADGIQLATGCTFGKDLIIRVPHGKLGVRIADQTSGRAVRVVPRREALERIERSPWFRVCEANRTLWKAPESDTGAVIEQILAVPDGELFSCSPVFPMRMEDPVTVFESFVCDECGETALVGYRRNSGRSNLCIACDERRKATAFLRARSG